MDGFAVRAQDTVANGAHPVTLKLVGESRAGHPAQIALGTGEAIAISTGAMVPAGADAVLRIERAQLDRGLVRVVEPVAVGQDMRGAGEDLRAGELALAAGTLLGPAELGVLASIGCRMPRCVKRPRVSLLSTGDELRPVGEPLPPGALHDSNSHVLAALLTTAGAQVVSSRHVGDDPEATGQAIEQALVGVDLAVVCGGMSVGSHDHVRPSLRGLGVQELFAGVRMRPGKPTSFGVLGATLVFGLPGNPVSALVAATLFVVPAIRKLLRIDPLRSRSHATFAADWQTDVGRADVVPCRLELTEEGWVGHPPKAQGSHRLSTIVGMNALALMPTNSGPVRKGDRVAVELLDGFVGWGG